MLPISRATFLSCFKFTAGLERNAGGVKKGSLSRSKQTIEALIIAIVANIELILDKCFKCDIFLLHAGRKAIFPSYTPLLQRGRGKSIQRCKEYEERKDKLGESNEPKKHRQTH